MADRQFYEIEFQGHQVRVNTENGAVIDPQEIKFVNDVVIKWSNSQQTGDWKEVKVSLQYLAHAEL